MPSNLTQIQEKLYYLQGLIHVFLLNVPVGQNKVLGVNWSVTKGDNTYLCMSTNSSLLYLNLIVCHQGR